MTEEDKPFLPRLNEVNKQLVKELKPLNREGCKKCYKIELLVHVALIALYTALSILVVRSFATTDSANQGNFCP